MSAMKKKWLTPDLYKRQAVWSVRSITVQWLAVSQGSSVLPCGYLWIFYVILRLLRLLTWLAVCLATCPYTSWSGPTRIQVILISMSSLRLSQKTMLQFWTILTWQGAGAAQLCWEVVNTEVTMKQSLPWNVLQPVPVPGCPWLSLGHRTLVGNEQPPSIDAARQLNSIDYLHIHKNVSAISISSYISLSVTCWTQSWLVPLCLWMLPSWLSWEPFYYFIPVISSEFYPRWLFMVKSGSVPSATYKLLIWSHFNRRHIYYTLYYFNLHYGVRSILIADVQILELMSSF